MEIKRFKALDISSLNKPFKISFKWTQNICTSGNSGICIKTARTAGETYAVLLMLAESRLPYLGPVEYVAKTKSYLVQLISILCAFMHCDR